MENDYTSDYQRKPTVFDIIITIIAILFFLGLVALCFLFFNYWNLNWLMLTGWVFLALSFILSFIIGDVFAKEEEEYWFASHVFIDRGIYKIVRHPIFLSFMLVVVALVFISQHWLSFLFGLPLLVFLYQIMVSEDKHNIKKFGDAYREYMKRVPMINFILGIIRNLKAR